MISLCHMFLVLIISYDFNRMVKIVPGLQLASSSPHQLCKLTTPKGKSGADAPRAENSRRQLLIICGNKHAYPSLSAALPGF